MSNFLRVLTHEDKPEIPVGYALMVMDNNGWIGTNNGQRYTGQPALFPVNQARALSLAWDYMVGVGGLEKIPEGNVPEEIMKWFTSNGSINE